MWQLFYVASVTVVVTLISIAILEYITHRIAARPWASSLQYFAPPSGILKDAVYALVGGAIAASATRLGLYYTTVGVIASTIYKDVPGEVRNLFIQERSSATYLKVVLYTLVGGVIILAGESLGYHFSKLTLTGLAAGVLATAIGLVAVTKRMFDFFVVIVLIVVFRKRIAAGLRSAQAHSQAAAQQRNATEPTAVYATQPAGSSVQLLEDDAAWQADFTEAKLH